MYPLVSVLVPAYNSEKYIQNCLNSIMKQTYEKLEILVLNDGSTDETGLIIDEIAKKDSRIKVIHKENQGVAAARNELLEASNGELILQVDADDYISFNAVDILLRNLEEADADLSVGISVMGKETDYAFPVVDKPDIQIFSGDGKFKKLFDEDKFDFISPCEKLYKKTLFKDLKYPVGRIHEDEYLAHLILDRASKVVYSKIPILYYTVKEDSITRSSFSAKRLDCVQALLERNNFFETKGNADILKLCYIDFLKRFQYFYYGMKYHYPEKKELISSLYDYYKDVYEKASKQDMLSLSERVLFGLFLKNTWLNYQARKILGKKAIDT